MDNVFDVMPADDIINSRSFACLSKEFVFWVARRVIESPVQGTEVGRKVQFVRDLHPQFLSIQNFARRQDSARWRRVFRSSSLDSSTQMRGLLHQASQLRGDEIVLQDLYGKARFVGSFRAASRP